MNQIELKSDMEVSLEQRMGGDYSIIAAARVSVVGQQSADAYTDDPQERAGLINFLMKNRHGTPFEHASMTFLVSAPIFVFREWHRHRIGWSYNEVSGRYSELKPVFWVPSPERNLVQQGKPGHYTFVQGTEEQYVNVCLNLGYAYEKAYSSYLNCLSDGIAKEVARACLPVAIYSSMWATCNPRSLMAFLSLRTKDERSTFPSFPMNEINECATKMENHFAAMFPITHLAFCNNGRVCP